MESVIKIGAEEFKVNFSNPLDISLQLSTEKKHPQAWYLGSPQIEPVRDGDWIAKVSEGASVNFNTITFSPHAHGTHTESYGHISEEYYAVSNCFDKYFFKAQLISLKPEKKEKDLIFTKKMMKKQLEDNNVEALIVRSLPNVTEKKTKNYNHTNWPYLTAETARFIREMGVKHLLIDLPSVDREEGDVLAHKAFWNYPKKPRKKATITEMIYVDDDIEDGLYLLNLQLANFKNNAAPSRPILYQLKTL